MIFLKNTILNFEAQHFKNIKKIMFITRVRKMMHLHINLAKFCLIQYETEIHFNTSVKFVEFYLHVFAYLHIFHLFGIFMRFTFYRGYYS